MPSIEPQVKPGTEFWHGTGLGTGSVDYHVESVHPLGADSAVAVIEQTYLDADGRPRDAKASHTHTYVVVQRDGEWRIAAGQNTVRA